MMEICPDCGSANVAIDLYDEREIDDGNGTYIEEIYAYTCQDCGCFWEDE